MGWFQKVIFGEKPGAIEQQVSRAEFMELGRRLKELERELDDLHASYRRIRATTAAGVRVANLDRDRNSAADAGAGDPPGRVARKSALREKARRMQRGPVQSDV